MRITASTTLLAAAGLMLAACSADTATSPVDPPAFDRAADVAICHRNDDTADFEFLMLPSNGRAVEKHLAHGDAFPGEPIPGGFTLFPADCSLPFHAIAYTDRDPNDGDGYRAGVDRLIAALLDTDGSLNASVGDEVYVFGFPVDLEASAYGSVAVPSHAVVFVLDDDCTLVNVSYGSRDGSYWQTPEYFGLGREQLLVRTPPGGTSLSISDQQRGPFSDRVFAIQGSLPNEPDRSVDLTDSAGAGTDDAFLDIEIRCTV